MITRGTWSYSPEDREIHAVPSNAPEEGRIIASAVDNADDGVLMAASRKLLAACEAAVAAIGPTPADDGGADPDDSAPQWLLEMRAAIALAKAPNATPKPALGYPAGWPTCPGCGLPALDGHITCGNVACDEAGRR